MNKNLKRSIWLRTMSLYFSTVVFILRDQSYLESFTYAGRVI